MRALVSVSPTLTSGRGLDVRDDVADVAGSELVLGEELRCLGFENTDFLDIVRIVRGHQLHRIARL